MPEVSISTLLAAFVGLVAILAVLLGIPRITSLVPTHVPVAANTGLCFVVLAIALRAAHMPSPTARWVTVLGASAVALIALTTGFEFVSGRDIGVDHWLFPAPEGASEMSPQTAVAFILLSVAILLSRVRAHTLIVRTAATAVLVFGFINILDVLYDAGTPTILGGFTQMALPTAATFIGLSLGVSALHPQGSILELIRLAGPAGALTRRLMVAALIIPIVVGGLRLAGERAGWYEGAYGVAIMTLMTILLFTAAVRITARTVERAEAERRGAEAALGDALGEITDLYDNAPSGYHSLDAEGRVVRINRTELDMLGYGRDEIIGRRFTDLMTPAGKARFAELYPRFLETGFLRDVDFEVIRRNGEILPVSISATALRDGAGGLTASRSTMQDMSAQRTIEREREQAMQAAVAANRAKSEFLSRMSHELRTPLNSVLGFAQLLETEELSVEQLESATYIRRAGRHLLDLINEVLDIARIDTGTLTISVEAVALRECLEEVTSFVVPLAANRGITVDISAVEDCGPYVLADRQRLRQVLLNLLSNAVKYNREGGRITVSCEPMGIGQMRMNVTDTGAGIAPASQSRLFQPFDRLGAETTDIEGSGMGLALSKALVEAMRGEIGVESEPGVGSTFWVAFPTTDAPDGALAAAPDAPIAADDSATHMEILYVEDNPADLRLVERIVARMPRTRLMTAMQGAIGLELAREHRPSLVVLDLHLPDMGGTEVLRQLRAQPETRDIPVMILSADGSVRQVRSLTAEGAQAYLTKPLDIREFIDTIERLALPTAVATDA